MTIYDTNSEHYKALMKIAATSGDRLKKRAAPASPISPPAVTDSAEAR